jgi:hypothetical protein
MKLGYLVKGFPGHPLHPPLTDATIGASLAAIFGHDDKEQPHGGRDARGDARAGLTRD